MLSYGSEVWAAIRAGLAIAADDSIWVTCHKSDQIVILDPSDGAIIRTIDVPYGAAPFGIAMSPDGGKRMSVAKVLGALRRYNTTTHRPRLVFWH